MRPQKKQVARKGLRPDGALLFRGSSGGRGREVCPGGGVPAEGAEQAGGSWVRGRGWVGTLPVRRIEEGEEGGGQDVSVTKCSAHSLARASWGSRSQRGPRPRGPEGPEHLRLILFLIRTLGLLGSFHLGVRTSGQWPCWGCSLTGHGPADTLTCLFWKHTSGTLMGDHRTIDGL